MTIYTGRGTPEGIKRNEMKDRLADMEAVAMLTRSRIWGETDPGRMIELRKKMRENLSRQRWRMGLRE